MPYYWVQQWIAIPVISENQMGDQQPEGSRPASDAIQGIEPSHSTARYDNSRHAQPLSMTAVAAALPQYPMHGQQSSATPYQTQQSQQQHQQVQVPQPNQQTAAGAAIPQHHGQFQYPPYAMVPYAIPNTDHGAFPAAGAHGQIPQLHHNSLVPGYPTFVQQPSGPAAHGQHPQHVFSHPSPYYYYGQPMRQPGQVPPFPAVPDNQFMTDRRSSLPIAQGRSTYPGPDPQALATKYPSQNRPSVVGYSGAERGSASYGVRRQSSEGNLSSAPRGPPRKPRQSGHALWVGNLPPGTTIVAMKEHFSQDATKDIESLFLISKSNCAFVNYRTEASCNAAMRRFHDSRFHGVRLVCRLRRGSAPGPGVPTGPAALSAPANTDVISCQAEVEEEEAETVDAAESSTGESTEEHGAGGDVSSTLAEPASERYFVVKSLTLQDLETSVRNGIWATQSHNEQRLNEAYESSQRVFLIFSANKSGEYFGYAKMASRISEDIVPATDVTPRRQAIDSADDPKSIPTPATAHAPRGRIIDDSARGTIFWEAELSDEDNDAGRAPQDSEDTDPGVTADSWGKQFKVEWLSTSRLPFYRTRGLRNPWNSNREVKIARDGTELETSVGERLLQMFHRGGSAGLTPPGGAMR